jgi:hypothetical protein
MTVQTSTITSGPYAGNGINDEFDYTFRITSSGQIVVFETNADGVVSLLQAGTDYSVDGVGDEAGGIVTRVAGPLPIGYKWYIRSNYLPTQETSFESQGAFFPQVHENAFDKLTILAQQLDDRIRRAFRFADSYSGDVDPTLPEPVPGAFLQWNADGTALENGEDISEILAISSAIIAVAAIADEIVILAPHVANIDIVADNIDDILAAPEAALLAMSWAIKMDGPVALGEYSAKYWAGQAAAIVGGPYLLLSGGTMTGDAQLNDAATKYRNDIGTEGFNVKYNPSTETLDFSFVG